MLLRENLAAAVLDADSVRAEDLAAAIDRGATDPVIARSVADWQRLVLSDGGVRRAADLIEAHAGRTRE